jgi:hypothetical protein
MGNPENTITRKTIEIGSDAKKVITVNEIKIGGLTFEFK